MDGMRKILIHMIVEPNGEYDVYSCSDYSAIIQTVQEKHGGICPNFGNRLWFQGLVSEITCEENELTFFSEVMTKDYINETFDCIIAPMANVFSPYYTVLLDKLAERFKGIRIPVYVIACGVQADSYDDIDDLCVVLKEPAGNFIKSVYNTGGEFALRGYFTKEFFSKLGFHSAVVTGCPSLFQCGRSLRMCSDHVSEEEFRPLLNGRLSNYDKPILKYDGEFFDQETFFFHLHDDEFWKEKIIRSQIKDLIKVHGYTTAKWLFEGKIKMIPCMNEWYNYLLDSNFHFSFGSRIHGSIMPILAGIPALIEARDARTREMAEFFGIPYILNGARKKKTLYELYRDTDYIQFCKTYSKKYDAYESFLKKHNIVNQINSCNIFLSRQENLYIKPANEDVLDLVGRQMKSNDWLWVMYAKLLEFKRKII